MLIALRQRLEFRRLKLLAALCCGPVDQKVARDPGGHCRGSGGQVFQTAARARGLETLLRGEEDPAHRERAPCVALHGVKSIAYSATNISGEDSGVEGTT